MLTRRFGARNSKPVRDPTSKFQTGMSFRGSSRRQKHHRGANRIWVLGCVWSGRRDLNPRPLVPQTSALTGLRHAPTGTARTIGLSATVDLISVSARMSQPYCKLPKRPLSPSRFLPCRARSASMFSNRWPSKREAGGLDAGWLTLLRLQLPGRQQTAYRRAC